MSGSPSHLDIEDLSGVCLGSDARAAQTTGAGTLSAYLTFAYVPLVHTGAYSVVLRIGTTVLARRPFDVSVTSPAAVHATQATMH
jgi:hypothetical protein